MTTKDSPPAAIHAQAMVIAKHMKALVPHANGKDTCKVGIAMDDKIITIEMPWNKLTTMNEQDLVLFVCAQMRDISPVSEPLH